jgi:hypothetical protein
MPDRLAEQLALLEAEIELLKHKIVLAPDNLVAKSDLSSCVETVYLLKFPANARHLMDSFEEYRSGKLVSQSIEELRQELGIDKQSSFVLEHKSNHEIWSPHDAFSAEKTLPEMLRQHLKEEAE